MNKDLCKEIYSKKFPFWDTLDTKDQNHICDSSIIKNFNKGLTIYDGSDDGGVILLNKGSLRVYIISDAEKELTLMRIHEGEICIFSASFINDPITFDIFVDAEEDCECYFICNETFKYINDKYPKAKEYALETTLDCFCYMMWIMQEILFMSMDKRLARFLLDEINRTEIDTVMLTHSLIAKYMGSAREVVSRMLKYFENEGIVELSRKGVKVIDKKRLYSIAQ